MFSIAAATSNGFDLLILKDENTGTRVELLPACGATLHAFVVQHNGGEVNIIDGYSSKKEFDEEMEAKGFKSAKLSPFVCRMKEGKYHYGEKEYSMEKFYLGQNALHGIIYNAAYEVISQQADEEQATVELLYQYKATDAGYPFFYDCKIVYSLSNNNSLSITTTIINKDAGVIPVADGWHPYFSFGGSINDCQLELQSKDILEFDDQLIPTGKLNAYEDFGSLKKIGEHFFDHCFTVNFAECQPMLVFRDPLQKLQLEIRPHQSYPYLQIYTPPHRKSIAIENLSAAPDAFNNGMGLINLPAGTETVFKTNYRVQKIN